MRVLFRSLLAAIAIVIFAGASAQAETATTQPAPPPPKCPEGTIWVESEKMCLAPMDPRGSHGGDLG